MGQPERGIGITVHWEGGPAKGCSSAFHTSEFWKAKQSTGGFRHIETFGILTKYGMGPNFTKK